MRPAVPGVEGKYLLACVDQPRCGIIAVLDDHAN
jgi:hypothetical protein